MPRKSRNVEEWIEIILKKIKKQKTIAGNITDKTEGGMGTFGLVGEMVGTSLCIE